MFTKWHLNKLTLLGLVVALILSACGNGDNGKKPDNALILQWVYSTNLQNWADASIADFNQQGFKTSDDRPIWIEGSAADSGQAISDMLSGAPLPALWTTTDTSWRDVLHSETGNEVFLPTCISIAESPLVIAMWEPIARALGWPGRTIGWLDVASLAADPSGWAYYSGGEWGDTLRIGHTHPGLSDSGAQTLQALIYAAESAPARITVENAQNPIVQASVGAFESAVSWFSPDMDLLSRTMQERGINYLHAAVTYENAVIAQGNNTPDLVAIYPYEGTFMATFPTCTRAGMDDVATDAASTFLAYLISPESQQRAQQNGLRPVSEIESGNAPPVGQYGVNMAEPTRVFNPGDADMIFAVQDLWQGQRRDVNLIMVIDVSGSMAGEKIDQVRQSAIEFVSQLGDNDQLMVIAFSDTPLVLVPAQLAANNRDQMIAAIQGLKAEGGTSLFDTVAFASGLVAETRRVDSISAMVVLTDGHDTASQHFTSANAEFGVTVQQSGASVYTIAYGNDADLNTMQNIALSTNGIFYTGDVSTIGDIYAEMSAAFGGNLGIGR